MLLPPQHKCNTKEWLSWEKVEIVAGYNLLNHVWAFPARVVGIAQHMISSRNAWRVIRSLNFWRWSVGSYHLQSCWSRASKNLPWGLGLQIVPTNPSSSPPSQWSYLWLPSGPGFLGSICNCLDLVVFPHFGEEDSSWCYYSSDWPVSGSHEG